MLIIDHIVVPPGLKQEAWCRAYGALTLTHSFPRFRLRVARLQHGLTSRRASGARYRWFGHARQK
jgi:hypothetical protein